MEPYVYGMIGLALLLVFVFYGVPIAISLASVGIIGLIAIMGVENAFSLASMISYQNVATFDYAVIPLFVLMGMLAEATGLSGNCFDTLALWLGKLRGGLGIATTWSCAAFGTLNGSPLVTASVFARAAVPSMRQYGYDRDISYGLCAAAGNIGQLIPPSILIVMYGALSKDSIGQLLMAGISPGIGLCIMFSLTLVIISFVRPDLVPAKLDIKTTWKERILALRYMIPIAVVALIIIGGIYSGIFSSAEAGAVGCAVFLFYGLIKRIPFKAYVNAFRETVLTAGMLFFIIMSGAIFGRFLTVSGFAKLLVGIVQGINPNPTVFLLLVVAVYLFLGCFMDAYTCMAITLPLFLPIADVLGIDRIHFAMTAILTMHCGGITPPVGTCAFCVKAVATPDTTIGGIFKGAFPFLIAMVILVVLFVFFPVLSTFLPNAMM